MDASEHENLFFKFKSDLMKIYAKRSEFASIKKALEQVVDREIQSIRRNPFQSDELKENTDTTLTNNLNNLSILKQQHQMLPPPPPLQSNARLVKDRETIMQEFRRYSCAHMIRAHSKDGSLHDNTTQVNDVAFELKDVNSDLHVLPKYTNLFATCGANIINIIDTNTGKVMKRYTDEMTVNRNKEVIYPFFLFVLREWSFFTG
jgi:hypothetical protein